MGYVDHKTAFAQTSLNKRRSLLFVFDDQYPHQETSIIANQKARLLFEGRLNKDETFDALKVQLDWQPLIEA